jgi:D-xylose transport system substrate-binding protein
VFNHVTARLAASVTAAAAATVLLATCAASSSASTGAVKISVGDINAALVPSDEIGAPIIRYLQGKGIPAKAFPITGQDATLPGLHNILSGYQCGTAYKPSYLEAQAAAALALFLRAHVKPPASLVNGQVEDGQAKVSVPSVLFNPVWVTTKNMKSTIIADKYVSVAQLCAGSYAAACKAAGITG